MKWNKMAKAVAAALWLDWISRRGRKKFAPQPKRRLAQPWLKSLEWRIVPADLVWAGPDPDDATTSNVMNLSQNWFWTPPGGKLTRHGPGKAIGAGDTL